MVKELRPGRVTVPPWRAAAAPTAASTSSAPATPDVGAIAAPGGALPLAFGYVDLAANLQAAQLYRAIPGAAGISAQIEATMLYRGSLLGMVLGATAAATAGSATFEAYVEGTSSGAKLAWSSSNRARMAFAAGTYPFQAGNSIGVRVSTTSAWSPVSADVEVILIVSFVPE